MNRTPKNFAITGVAGYIAPRHLRAIRDTGNRVVAATDPHDSVGLLDQFGLDVRYFPEFERFDRFLEKRRRGADEDRVHYVSICAPNYLHDAHCRLALRVGADAICEKPLVINPWNLDPLLELERETGRRIFTVLQLRLHDSLVALRQRLLAVSGPHHVCLTYITCRGSWYHSSWKGQIDKSGGIATNIGIHFFDLLLWLFGPARDCRVHVAHRDRMAGFFELERARVTWFLSTAREDLPLEAVRAGRQTFRSIEVDGHEVEFSEGFTDLHTKVYNDILAGGGFGIEDARPSIDLVHRVRMTAVTPPGDLGHPLLKG
jgi:UDP-N-acetyl-2-amino-2-deoxyglucuronate dehydrogenase